MFKSRNKLLYKVMVLVLFIFLSGCTSSRKTTVKNSSTLVGNYTKKSCYLNKGTIFLISSSSQYDEKVIPEIETVFANQCYSVDKRYLDQKPTKLGYVNTDEKRASTLINALSDNNVKYLWFVRGGSGALNLYPALYKSKSRIVSSTPKILIGFSDVTALHGFVNHELNWPSVHGVLASYNKEIHVIDNNKQISMNNSINDIFKALSEGINYTGVEKMNAYAGKSVSGKLDGGNLTLVQSLFSTVYEGKYSDKIMLLEDTGVTARQLDRTLHQISYDSKFNPRAVVFGQFYSLNASEAEKQLYRYVVEQFANRVSYPVYYYPEFGHGKTNQPFILDHQASIACNSNSLFCSLNQSALNERAYHNDRILKD